MARSTRRKERREAEDDEEGEGDDFAWQPKKKKSSKKPTGRSERPTGSSSTKKSKSARSKSSDGAASSTRSKKKKIGAGADSTRKSGSARRKRPPSDDGDEDGNSGRRRRAAPPKKKGVDPIVPISIVSATVLICIGLYLFLNKTPPPQIREDLSWDSAKKLEEEGMAAYGAFVKARDQDQPDVTKRKRTEAIAKLKQAVDAMNAVLDPKRDKDGYLPDEFEGYERDLSQIAKYLIDLEKM